jgi:APA family basic amino acid/polyamine antiporter
MLPSSATVPSSSRVLGFWTAVALVMGNMIGSGVFLLPASLAPFGGVALIGWFVSAAGSVCLALVFARLSTFTPASGGPYAYTRHAFGDVAGFLVAWGYWISIWCSEAALAVALVGYLDPFVPSLVRAPGPAAVLAIGFVCLLTLVNVIGVRTAGRVQVVTTVLKILPLVLVGVGGLFALDPSHFAVTSTDPRTVAHGISATATLTLWAFLGLECATIPAGSIQSPEVTIPRATVAGTVVTAAIYIISTIGVLGLLAPAALSASTAPYADAAQVLVGPRAAALVAIGAAISCFGALNGWILVSGQLPLAVAADGLFPRVFGRVSGRGTPARAMVIAAILASGLIAMNYSRTLVQLFTFIILLATLSTLVPYAFCSMAALLVGGGPPRTRLTRAAASVAVLGFAYSIYAIVGAGADVVYSGFILLLCGLPVYVWVVRQGPSRPHA